MYCFDPKSQFPDYSVEFGTKGIQSSINTAILFVAGLVSSLYFLWGFNGVGQDSRENGMTERPFATACQDTVAVRTEQTTTIELHPHIAGYLSKMRIDDGD